MTEHKSIDEHADDLAKTYLLLMADFRDAKTADAATSIHHAIHLLFEQEYCSLCV